MADLIEKCAPWKDVQVLKIAGHYPYYRVIEATDGTEVVVDGKRLIMACSNNYLGLATDPRVMEAAAEAVEIVERGGYPQARHGKAVQPA